ncbi:hypothetical protein [uncultured Selenomonas sp.]|uniref:hypothetical protein n=1 Tax=uncultured Selenomonas sp. TaxID=159275 RepID=UPI0025F1D3D4|nr:hypothetical protein [uncultured Selenomonas sp.]
MKTTCRTTHIYKPHSRAERALVLAVLTALLSGAAATPAMARDRTIAEDETVTVTNATRETNHRACLTYSATEKESDTNNITNSTSGNTLTLLGTVDASVGNYMAWITPAYSGGQMSSLRTMYSSKAARPTMGLFMAAGPRAAR